LPASSWSFGGFPCPLKSFNTFCTLLTPQPLLVPSLYHGDSCTPTLCTDVQTHTHMHSAGNLDPHPSQHVNEPNGSK
jgi:hypothetical protein